MLVRLLAFLTPLVAVIALDRVTKAWAREAIWEPPRTIVVVPGWLELTPVANRGIAFGLLQDTGSWLALVAVVVLSGVAIQRRRQILEAHWAVRAPLGLIGGGAIGNIIDRVQLGYVPDFVRVPHIGIFQVFNVADASIVVGTAILVVAVWLLEQAAPKKVESQPAEEATAAPPTEVRQPEATADERR